VVFATQVVDLARILNNQISAMCANIAQTVTLTLLIAGEQNRLVEIILKYVNWRYPAGILYLVGVAHELPASGKDLFLRLFQIF
jgi:hypothetical protein